MTLTQEQKELMALLVKASTALGSLIDCLDNNEEELATGKGAGLADGLQWQKNSMRYLRGLIDGTLANYAELEARQ
ncbi:MAG: hypothetical protein IJS08_15765 [Victivallales bacterium]|nr:hypothetical protein [Victivallales bacterium]